MAKSWNHKYRDGEERAWTPMNKESLTEKLLDLVEGRETPETWRSWWDEHETESEALLSRGEFLKLKPCRHGFQWVPVFGSQKGAIAILEKSGTAFEASNLYQERYLRSWTLSARNRSKYSGKSKRNSRPTTRSCFDATPSSPRRWQRCWTPLMRSSLPPRRRKSQAEKGRWTSRSRPRCGSSSC